MMKKLIKTSILLSTICLAAILPSTSQDMTAKEIVSKANDKVTGESSRGSMKMTIVRPDWTREVTLKAWSKGQDLSMILITGPAKDKGQVFLKRGTEMWNWMPSISRMIKIPPSMMSQSWMGSDFTNDDLVRMNSLVEDFEHSFQGSETVNGYECYRIQLLPKPEAAVVWGKIILWISREEFYEMKAEYYDEQGGLVSTMTSSDIRQMGDRKLPAKTVMEPADEPGNQTILEMIGMEFNIPMDETFFSQQNMKNLH